MAIRAVLFDLDGTLVDSAQDLAETLNGLLAEEGLAGIGLDDVKSMIGDGVGKLMERGLAAAGGNPSLAPALLPRFLKLYEARAARHTRLYPGCVEALTSLAEKGLRLGLVTNKPYNATLEILDALDLARYFGAVVCGDTLPERKPHPAPLRLAAARLGTAPRETVMVGDNHHDIDAARAAGMAAIAIRWGYAHLPHEELGADRTVTAFCDLPLALTALAKGRIDAAHTQDSEPR
jgi:phosphoglycolate phosphatase